ncbi:hypothetical protein Bcav_2068 [Beutenbergia cavernae DSM 12333]|uniref:Uncharacterized protein n=1 Tax=Beutenbergia cavernae (strain ATCC BAA-8 / DSM 12333 / CCUG 43141 / JCM 11478 / NBRC 16432 / NCIMB 13614 / HKI 0122) TaxID=471853 RepID=C5C6B7_BEUC1|nr:hypothetical protein Bcav_2068 [Beutenbergia cavernae DSM 12333]
MTQQLTPGRFEASEGVEDWRAVLACREVGVATLSNRG